MSRVQVIRPAGAGHETLYVLLVGALIVALAASVVLMRGERVDDQPIASHQVDARRDLSPAEQGLYTDLRVALDEIRYLREEQGSTPEVEALASEGLPPFVDDAGSQSRGNHQWSRLAGSAYLGRSQAPDIAGHLLMVVPDESDAEADVWLNRDTASPSVADLSPASLIAVGWRQIVSHYDAGVTREHRH